MVILGRSLQGNRVLTPFLASAYYHKFMIQSTSTWLELTHLLRYRDRRQTVPLSYARRMHC